MRYDRETDNSTGNDFKGKPISILASTVQRPSAKQLIEVPICV